MSSCDVTGDIIVLIIVSLYIIGHVIFITEFKLKLSCAKHEFWKIARTGFNFRHLLSFKPKPKSKTESFRQMACESEMTMILSMLYDKHWPRFAFSKEL